MPELLEADIRDVCESFADQVEVIAGGPVEHVPEPRPFASPQSRNVILYGPPGTGKTYSTVDLALELLGVELESTEREEATEAFRLAVSSGAVSFVTFHQSYSYEDFVEGIRPQVDEASQGLTYSITPGIFKSLSMRAKLHPDDAFVLVIDEINRGNISGIFGELISLIEDSKRLGRSESLSVVLPYSREAFGVPDNLFIIGTMNTADRSLTGLDVALRRRFEFRQMLPREDLLSDGGAGRPWEIEGVRVQDILAGINVRLRAMRGADQLVGHAFFMPLSYPANRSIDYLSKIFLHRVLPLLHECFYDDPESIMHVLGQAKPNGSPGNYVKKRLSPIPGDGNIWDFDESVVNSIDFYRQVADGSPSVNPRPARSDWIATNEDHYERDRLSQ